MQDRAGRAKRLSKEVGSRRRRRPFVGIDGDRDDATGVRPAIGKAGAEDVRIRTGVCFDGFPSLRRRRRVRRVTRRDVRPQYLVAGWNVRPSSRRPSSACNRAQQWSESLISSIPPGMIHRVELHGDSGVGLMIGCDIRIDPTDSAAIGGLGVSPGSILTQNIKVFLQASSAPEEIIPDEDMI